MLRKMTIECAIAVAMLAAPATLSARPMGGFGGGMHSFGAMHSSGAMHSLNGPRSFGMTHGPVGWSHAAVFPNHHVDHFDHFAHFHHFHHFRHRHHFPFFVAGIDVGYTDSCWRWVPTPHGWRWAWVCNYDYY